MEKTISRVFSLTNTETQSWAVVTGLAASAPVRWYITKVLDQWSDDRFVLSRALNIQQKQFYRAL